MIKSASQRDTLSRMTPVELALGIIIAKCPDLVESAQKQLARPNETLRVKATAALATKALSGAYDLTKKDRSALIAVSRPVDDGKRSHVVPPVRITAAQLKDLEDEAQKRGASISDVVRGRLFGW